eukprot:s948_g14.t1
MLALYGDAMRHRDGRGSSGDFSERQPPRSPSPTPGAASRGPTQAARSSYHGTVTVPKTRPPATSTIARWPTNGQTQAARVMRKVNSPEYKEEMGYEILFRPTNYHNHRIAGIGFVIAQLAAAVPIVLCRMNSTEAEESEADLEEDEPSTVALGPVSTDTTGVASGRADDDADAALTHPADHADPREADGDNSEGKLKQLCGSVRSLDKRF